MGYFDRATKRVVLPTDSNLWVDVYTDLTWGEMRELGALDQSGNAILAADKGLTLLVADWNLTDGEQKAPLDEDHFNKLKVQDVTAIFDSINAVVQDESKKKVADTDNVKS